jgi:hypothetical protein
VPKRQFIPGSAFNPAIVVLPGDVGYTCQESDQLVCVEAVNALVVLPPNPVVGKTTIQFTTEQVCTISGGTNPLPVDPLPIAALSNFLASFTALGWIFSGNFGPPGASGTVPVSGGVGTQPTYQGLGWTTILDLDLTNIPNQTLGPDGNVNFAGFSWTKGNSAAETATAAIVNGTGLVLQPAAASDYNGPTRTLPYLWLPLAALFGSGQLSGLQWVLPSTGAAVNGIMPCLSSSNVVAINGGDPTVTYNLTFRFRGVVEQKTYNGGTNDGAFFQIGGAPAGDGYNVYKLTISSPAQTYYLNRGTSGQTLCYPIDYQKTLPVNGGATVTLFADSVDNNEVWNSSTNPPVQTPISVPGITSPTQPFNGQFVQMDVLSGITYAVGTPVPLDWNTQLRLWVSVGADNASQNFDNMVCGIDSNSTDFGLLIKRGFGTAGQGSQAFWQIGNAAPGGFISDGYNMAVSNQTLLLQMQALAAFSVYTKSFRGAALGPGGKFPALSTMSPGLWGQNVAVNSRGTSTSTPSSLGIFLGAQRAGGAAAYSTTIQRIRLDYRN